MQDIVHQTLLESILQTALGQLPKPPDHRGKPELEHDQADDQTHVVPQQIRVSPCRAVHDVPQKKGVEHADTACRRLEQRQDDHEPFLFSGSL